MPVCDKDWLASTEQILTCLPWTLPRPTSTGVGLRGDPPASQHPTPTGRVPDQESMKKSLWPLESFDVNRRWITGLSTLEPIREDSAGASEV